MGRGRGDRGSRMSLVGSSDPKSAEKKAREFAALFEKRKPTLKKKAKELATLCAVPVAVVAALPGGNAPDVWESEEGVLDRYRELPAEKRAEHTHARYLEDQLGKVTAKLARMRQNGPPALAPPDSMLSRMTLEELRELLKSVDAALLATAKRRKALGLPDEDEDEAVEPRGHGVPCIGGNPAVGLEDYQMQPPTNAVIYESHHNQPMLDAFPSYNNDHKMIPESDMMQPGYYNYNTGMMQPACNAQHIGGNYTLQNQISGNGNNHHGLLASVASFQSPNTTMRPTDFGSFGTEGYQMPPQGNGYSIGGYPLPSLEDWRTEGPRNYAIEPAGYDMGIPSQYAANGYSIGGYPFPSLEDWRPEGPRNYAIEPAGYHMGIPSQYAANGYSIGGYPFPSLEDWRTEGPRNHMGTPAQYTARVNGGNFTNTTVAAVKYMGTGGNVASYVDDRETQSSSNEYQYSGNTSQNSSSNEEMHYPSDVAEARRQYWEN